jgi:predicted small secreted protein
MEHPQTYFKNQTKFTKTSKSILSMKFSSLVMLNLAALLVAGCNTTPTRVETGPIRASSFSFVAAAPRTTPDFAPDRWKPIHALIQDSISRNLAGKGLNKVASGGDVIVAYLVIVGDNASTTALNTYFGYGRDADALHDKAQAAYDNSKNPNYFQAGTLLVDILDAKTYKLLNRSFVVRPLLRNPTAEIRAERIQEAVDAVLKDVRIAH